MLRLHNDLFVLEWERIIQGPMGAVLAAFPQDKKNASTKLALSY